MFPRGAERCVSWRRHGGETICNGASCMSGQLQRGVAAPIRTTGVRSIARALLLSLCVHAAIVGALWYLISTSLPPTPHDLRVEVELTPRAAPAEVAISTAPAPVEKAIADAVSGKTGKPRAESIVHTQVKIASPATRPDALNAMDINSQGAAAAPPSVQATESAPASRDAPTIDLRVLEWLARYRTYPLAARRAGLEGVVQLRVTLMPDGRFVDARVERSSGHALLDQAALDLLAHAAPLPADFSSERSAQIELRLPIVYRMRASST